MLEWDVHGDLVRAPRGHTNETFFVGESFVLRRSFAGKPLAQVSREETILRALPEDALAPRLVPTPSGNWHVVDGDRFVHLFERRPGAPANSSSAASALVHLKCLHGMLAQLPDGGSDGLEWLRERHRQIRAGAPLPGFERALDRIERLLEIKVDGSQWLHGDYHLGNLLVEDGRISGVVDFDDTGRGAATVEAAFAGFAVSRDETCEDAFRYDPRIFDEARAAYGHLDRELEPLFWADQVLIHLRAAQKGLWKLGPGIGFLGPFRSLMQ